MNVYVFKTSVNPEDVHRVDAILRSEIPESRWNFDLEDCDKVLRVESDEDISRAVCAHLKVFDCEELE